MNFVLENKITEAENIKINSKGIFYLKNNTVYKDEFSFYTSDKDINEFDINDNYLYLIKNNETLIFSLEKKTFIKIPFPIIFNSIISNNAIFTYNRNIKKRLFQRAYYELNDDFKRLNEIENFNTLGKSFFNEDFFLFKSKKSDLLCAFTYLDKKLWEFDLSSIELKTKIEKFIGIHKNRILILLNKGKLLLLDSNTGTLLNTVNLLENQEVILESVHLDNQKGLLKSLAGRYYFEFCLNNLRLEIKKDFGKYSKGNWWISRSNYYGDLLTFVGSKDGISSFANSFGIFDTNKLEIMWYDTISPEKRDIKVFFSNPPLINDSTLIIRNSNKTLSIYKSNVP